MFHSHITHEFACFLLYTFKTLTYHLLLFKIIQTYSLAHLTKMAVMVALSPQGVYFL